MLEKMWDRLQNKFTMPEFTGDGLRDITKLYRRSGVERMVDDIQVRAWLAAEKGDYYCYGESRDQEMLEEVRQYFLENESIDVSELYQTCTGYWQFMVSWKL